jgi:ADP-glucose pyrophosphorylase
MEGAVVMSGAVVRHSVLGPDARVGRRAEVTGQSLIGRGQVVGDDARVDGARIPDEG